MESENIGVSILRIILKMFIFFLTLLMSIPIVLVIVPLHILRQSVGLLAKFIHPEFVRLVSLRSSIWAADTLYTSPESNITVVGIFSKKIPQASIIDEVTTKLLPKHPRLRQHFEIWLGYAFWKKDEVFDIQKHLTTLDRPVTGQKQLLRVANEINRLPWVRNQSPWCGVHIEDYRAHAQAESTCAWIWNNHHALADALGVQCMFRTLTGEDTKKIKPTFNDLTGLPVTNINTFRRFLKFIDSLYKFVSDLPTLKDNNDLRRFGSQISKDREIQYFGSSRNEVSIPFARVKQIQDRFNVSTTAVMAALAGGCLERLCAQETSRAPPLANLMLPFPHPEHTRQTTNYQTLVFVKVPIGNASGVTRLRAIEAEVKRQREVGTYNIFYNFLPLVIGSMPIFLTKRVYKVDLPTAVLISISIDPMNSFQGAHMTDIPFMSGPLPGNQGIFFFFMKFGETFKIGLGLSTSFLRTQEVNVETLLQSIEDEINTLLITEAQ